MAKEQVVEVRKGKGAMHDALKEVFEETKDMMEGDADLAMSAMEAMEEMDKAIEEVKQEQLREASKLMDDMKDVKGVKLAQAKEVLDIDESKAAVLEDAVEPVKEAEAEPEIESVEKVKAVEAKPLKPANKQAVKPKVVEVGLFSEHAPVLGKKAITMLNRYVAAMDVNVSARPNRRNQTSKQRELDHLYSEILSSANATDKITALIKIFRSHVVFTESLIFRHTIDMDTGRVSSEHFTKLSSIFTTAAREGVGAVTRVSDLDLLRPAISQQELNVLKSYFK